MSTTFQVVLFLHVLSVITGFGFLAYNGLFLTLAYRRNAPPSFYALNTQVSELAELSVYGAFVFGVVAVGLSHNVFRFSQLWVWLSIVLFLALVGVLHGWIKTNQRRYLALTKELAESPAPAGSRPPNLSKVKELERRVALGWGAFNLILVSAIFLMVFKPGL